MDHAAGVCRNGLNYDQQDYINKSGQVRSGCACCFVYEVARVRSICSIWPAVCLSVLSIA